MLTISRERYRLCKCFDLGSVIISHSLSFRYKYIVRLYVMLVIMNGINENVVKHAILSLPELSTDLIRWLIICNCTHVRMAMSSVESLVTFVITLIDRRKQTNKERITRICDSMLKNGYTVTIHVYIYLIVSCQKVVIKHIHVFSPSSFL